MKLIPKRKRKKIRNLLTLAAFVAINLTLSATAEETRIVKNFSSSITGTFSVRTWIGSNSVDQFINILNPEVKDNKGFVNSKQSMTLMELDSNYWFGFITQNQLFTWGPLFGIGVNFAYGKNSFQNLQATQGITADLVTYNLGFSFARIAFLHDDKMSKYLSLSGSYTSYSNSLSGGNPLNGLGFGTEFQYNIADAGDINFKLNYIPVASSGRLTNSWGVNSDLVLKWFISPKVALNLGYKAIYYTGQVAGQTTAQDSEGKAVNLNVNLLLHDIFHGALIGTSFYF